MPQAVFEQTTPEFGRCMSIRALDGVATGTGTIYSKTRTQMLWCFKMQCSGVLLFFLSGNFSSSIST